MNPALALNLFSDTGTSSKSPGIGMPGKIGADLFKSLLSKETKPFGKMKIDGKGPGFSGKKVGRAHGATAGNKGDKNRPIACDASLLVESGFPINLLAMPPKSAEKLITFLQEKGLNRGNTLALVKMATDKDGFIHMDRLMAGLAGIKGVSQGREKGLVIGAKDVPQVQELLFKMGLGVGEVKALIEHAGDGKGNLLLSKLFAALSKKFPDIDSPEKLVGLLSRFGLTCRSNDMTQEVRSPDLKGFMNAFAEASSEDTQKHIKTVLAELLREKGVPPEKVKSFLEGMTVSYTKNVSKSQSADRKDPGLWNGLVLRQQHKIKNDPWTEKILAILKEARTGAQQANETNGKFLQSFLLGEEDQLNPANKSAAERLAALLRTGEDVTASKVQRILKGPNLDGKSSFSSGESFLKTGVQDGAGKVIYAPQNAGVFARALEYVQSTSPVSPILERMQWMMQAGKQHARIQLSPPELGHIDLRLVIDQGHIQAHLGTENPMVKEMIQANLDQLKQQLAGLGFVVEEFNVHVGADGRNFMDQEELWSKAEKTGSWLTSNPGVEPIDPDPQPSRRVEDDLYQINVRV